jgi:hypothetical protein
MMSQELLASCTWMLNVRFDSLQQPSYDVEGESTDDTEGRSSEGDYDPAPLPRDMDGRRRGAE